MRGHVDVYATQNFGSARFTRLIVNNASGPVNLPNAGVFLISPRSRGLWVNLTFRNQVPETGSYVLTSLTVTSYMGRLTTLSRIAFAWSNSTNESDFLIPIDKGLWETPNSLFFTAQLLISDPSRPVWNQEWSIDDTWEFQGILFGPSLTVKISNATQAHSFAVLVRNEGTDQAFNVSMQWALSSRQESGSLSNIGVVDNQSERSFDIVAGRLTGPQKINYNLSYYNRLGDVYNESGSVVVYFKRMILVTTMTSLLIWTDSSFEAGAHVSTEDGKPVPNVPVLFLVQQNGQEISDSLAYTDQSGTATTTLVVSSQGNATLRVKVGGDLTNAEASSSVEIVANGSLSWLVIAVLLALSFICLGSLCKSADDDQPTTLVHEQVLRR